MHEYEYTGTCTTCMRESHYQDEVKTIALMSSITLSLTFILLAYANALEPTFHLPMQVRRAMHNRFVHDVHMHILCILCTAICTTIAKIELMLMPAETWFSWLQCRKGVHTHEHVYTRFNCSPPKRTLTSIPGAQWGRSTGRHRQRP